MLEFMIEIVITAFAFGGILGAVVALHLSTNLKQTEDAHKPASATIELPHTGEPAKLKPVPVDIASRQTTHSEKHHR